MEKKIKDKFDFLITGSGFAGSILAMCLVKSGYKVCMVEKDSHPRFAIGESSTPIADMILRDLAGEYELNFLNEMSRYGDWQRYHPDLTCGLKRGFSYYQHTKGELFSRDQDHKKDLLVAASRDDENSDTNWLRSDVDHFLVKKALEIGVCYYQRAEILHVLRMHEQKSWQIDLIIDGYKKVIETEWIIDATGSPVFSKKFFGTTVTVEPFYTESEAIFTHMNDVVYWSDHLKDREHFIEDYPYNPDHSALHHLIDEGWIWMLRFNNDLLSCGLLLEGEIRKQFSGISAEECWDKIIQSYPSIRQLFLKGKLCNEPGKFVRTERLQRLLSTNHGDGWIALNHTVGFVDPMHSTGIAHSLKGIEDLLAIFNGAQKSAQEIEKKMAKLYEVTRKEIFLIDKLVSMSYKSRQDFELFHTAVMLYFVATVQYEQTRLKGYKPESFLCADDKVIDELVTDAHLYMTSLKPGDKPSRKQKFIQSIKNRIEPMNSVGLMDESKNNMYSHTAVTL